MSKQSRTGVFVGGYVPTRVRKYLDERAAREGGTRTQALVRTVDEAIRRDAAEQPPRGEPQPSRRNS